MEPAQGRAAGVGESDLKLFSIAISAPKNRGIRSAREICRTDIAGVKRGFFFITV